MEGYVGPPHGITRKHKLVAPFQKVAEFLSDVDLLIHEAQFTNQEYFRKIGWGHSSLSNACLLAKLARVKRWLVVHHDPEHDDAFLESKLMLTRNLMKQMGYPIPVAHGYDGMSERWSSAP